MLDLLNKFSHGFAAVPVVLACERHDLFASLQQDGTGVEALASRLQANAGHLHVALRMLQSLGWLDVRDDRFFTTPLADERRHFPEALLELYRGPVPDLEDGAGAQWRCRPWLERSLRRWDGASELSADLLDGAVLVPLILRIMSDQPEKGGLFERIDSDDRRLLVDVFIQRDWAEPDPDRLVLSEAGRFLMKRFFNTALIASYRPMFAQIDQVIFGDCAAVFARGADGAERHVDRSLNVQSSGFMHEKYFSDAIDLIVEIFDQKPFEQQPRYLMDTGCGDGTFLKSAYEAIRTRSARGQVLERFPLTLIGADLNEAARVETARTLSHLPHLIVPGDISRPAEILDRLRANGVEDPEAILHIRSFLDHECPLLPVDTVTPDIGGPGYLVSVDAAGRAAPTKAIAASASAYLGRWKQVLGRHGMILLEVHCVDPKVASRYLGECESTYFDAFHGFSGQNLLDSRSFLMAAARAGLVPHPGSTLGYPRNFPFRRISLNHFVPGGNVIRHPVAADIDALMAIEAECWEGGLRTDREVLLERVTRHQTDQYVVEVDGRVGAVLYTQPVREAVYTRNPVWQSLDTLRDADGDALQLISLNVSPGVRHRGVGDQLLEFVLSTTRCMPGVRKVVGISRTSGFSGSTQADFRDYLDARDRYGMRVDPVLRFHEGHGADILHPVPGYRAQDAANLSNGVAIQYLLEAPPRRRVSSAEAPARAPVLSTLEIVSGLVVRVKGMTDTHPDSDQPFLEMGFDSSELLDLRAQLNAEFDETLDSSFLFRHNTITAVAAAIEGRRPSGPEAPDPALAPDTGAQAGADADGKALEEIRLIVDMVLGEAFDTQDPDWSFRPFLELGFDSAQILELRTLLNEHYGCTLDSTFLFRKNTGAAVAAALGPARAACDERPAEEDRIAIVAMACRFPGGNTEGFRDLLMSGRDGVGPMPAARRARYGPGDVTDGAHWQGGYLEDIDAFDARLFRMTPVEAELTDPQQRILLELTWELFESAGHAPRSFRGSRTGVWIGACHFEYRELLERSGTECSGHWAVGTFGSILSNRLSYYFDLTGPSISVDTACSSSLVALHDAAEAIRAGRCDAAIAGGVNLICGRTNTQSFQHAGMLSPRGRCYSFDGGADGYVRGEGAGLLLLKRLDRALADGDRIHGILAGAAVNHGGQASSITAPSPDAQSRVIEAALRNARLTPDDIGYVEAHGSGTSLGDPIEISGLRQAFEAFGTARSGSGPIPVGTVKSNIGHLEGAAGIAGVIKVLLAMREDVLPGNLNFHGLNPHIDLGDGRFRIAERTESWPRAGASTPRRAGVSSFGFGGVNAHVVLEEHVSARVSAPEVRPELVILSARSAEQLGALARNMRDILGGDTGSAKPLPELRDIAHTLQVGRDDEPERLAIIVQTPEGLRQSLDRFLTGTPDNDTFSGRVSSRPGGGSAEALPGRREDLKGLAKAWVGGASVRWEDLWRGESPARVPLPGYVFRRDRYWVPSPATAQPNGNATGTRTLVGPLACVNRSDLQGLRFDTHLEGSERFLTDHIVGGRPVLPAVTYIEMARRANAEAAGGAAGTLVLHDVAWVRPLLVDSGGTTVSTRIAPEPGGGVDWRIVAGSGLGDAGDVIHAQGRAEFSATGEEMLDIDALLACPRTDMDSAALYRRFSELGIDYGPSHRRIVVLYHLAGRNGAREVLARLAPDPDAGNTDHFLDPGLLDCALQGFLVLPGQNEGFSGRLPFASRRVDVLGPSPSEGWAWLRCSDPQGEGSEIDIDLCDRDGRITLRMRELTLRPMAARLPLEAGDTHEAAVPERFEPVTLAPAWERAATTPGPLWPASGERVVLLGGDEAMRSAFLAHCPSAWVPDVPADSSIDEIRDRLAALGPLDHVIWLAPKLGAEPTVALFRLVKALVGLGHDAGSLGLTVVTVSGLAMEGGAPGDPEQAGVHGLTGSLAKECPGWRVRVADLGETNAEAAAAVLRLPAEGQGEPLAWRKGAWWRQELLPVELPAATVGRYRIGGVYAVIGGAGGLGEVWSAYMIRTYRAQIVWIGRRPQDGGIGERLARLGDLGGPAPVYLQADAGDAEQMTAVRAEIHRCFGGLNGLVHSALVLRDRSLARMEEDDFLAAYEAKSATTRALARVFEGDGLDFVLFFSSIQSFRKFAGQSNYAAGCTFSDAAARALDRAWDCPVKVVNWGYWGSVGAVANAEHRSRMAAAGLGSIEPAEAMALLERLLAGPLQQVGYLKLDPAKPLAGASSRRIVVYGSGAPSMMDRIGAYRARPAGAAAPLGRV